MAASPQKVQTIDEIAGSLTPHYASSTNVINSQKNLIPQKYDAQRSALDAAKVQGFNQINDQATGRGMSFSGVPLHEQANYLSTVYLPGQQQADYQQNADLLALDQALADLDMNKVNQAIGIRQTQQGAMDQWLLQQSQQDFQREQNALDRAQQASLSASRGGGGGGGSSATGPTPNQYLIGAFENATGDWRTGGYTESNVLNQYAAAYGKTIGEAATDVYNFRKQYYGF